MLRRYPLSLNAERSRTRLAPRQRVQRIRAATLLCAALAIVSISAEMEDILDCRFPEPPVLPTGSSAGLDAMDRGATDVRSFVNAMQKSLDCLDTKTNATETTDVVRARTTLLYNNGVEQMQAIATGFNNQLQIFRDRENGKTARRGTESIGTNQVQALENRSHH